MNQVLINGTTLRDGEQAAGVAFTKDEKVVQMVRQESVEKKRSLTTQELLVLAQA